jgi:hypothetical protein
LTIIGVNKISKNLQKNESETSRFEASYYVQKPIRIVPFIWFLDPKAFHFKSTHNEKRQVGSASRIAWQPRGSTPVAIEQTLPEPNSKLSIKHNRQNPQKSRT